MSMTTHKMICFPKMSMCSLSEILVKEAIRKFNSKYLEDQIKIVESEIIAIKQSESFKTIINIDDWNEYFNCTKQKLQRELEELQLEIKG